MTYSFLQKFLGAPFAPEMAVDLLQCFPANCLYGGRNRKNSIYVSFDMEEPYITIDTYHEQMCEALCALRSGLRFYENASQLEEDDLEKGDLYLDAGMQCRYAFLLAANALEAAANALLLELDSSRALYEDLERLQTLLKFEVVCLAHGKKLDRGNALYGGIVDVVKCRNEFVHPKPRKTWVELTQDGSDVEISVSKTKNERLSHFI